MKGLSECKASESNIRRIRVKDIVKKVKDYLKTHSSARMDISCYEEGLIDQIYELETQRFTIQASSSKALISNSYFQDSDSDVEEDQRTSNDIMAYLKAEFHERALLANQKRFYKRSGRVGSARKPIDKSKETYDERTTRIKAFMAIAEDEPFVGKADARSGQWVNITMKKVHILLYMTNGDERKHVLDYTRVNLYYVED
ncbi:hypothetical protein Tco_0644876 [Tanacetum coccineum]